VHLNTLAPLHPSAPHGWERSVEFAHELAADGLTVHPMFAANRQGAHFALGNTFLFDDLPSFHWGAIAVLALRNAVLAAFAVLVLGGGRAWSDDVFDANVRAQMLKHGDGRVAHLETEYNNLFIDKHGSLLGLSSMYAGRPNYVESIVDLKDPDAMPVPYNQTMMAALAYPKAPKRILMIGLGAGSISTYLGRAMPDAQIDVVELDPGVIAAGKDYFGLRETDRVRLIAGDGRVYLNRHKELYDLILLDAFRELGIPFQLLTREFYGLVKEHLAPGGAMASNIAANTKLYLSTLITLGAVFPTVDVYPDWIDRSEAQAIAVAMPAPRPTADNLLGSAAALQQQYHFRYSLPALAGKRVTEPSSEGGDLLTDDFAPVEALKAIEVHNRKWPQQ